MREAAKKFEFEKAAKLRDQVKELRTKEFCSPRTPMKKQGQQPFTALIAQMASTLLESRKSMTDQRIERLFSTPVPKELWHYTTVNGLKGILTSNKLWATEAHSTTDKTEFIHARDVALSYLQRLKTANKDEEDVKLLALTVIGEEFESGTLSTSEIEVFVISFSSAENLKSQWSEYADQHRGVSIAFDLSKVRPPQELEIAVTLAPCVYEDVEKEALLKTALQNFLQTASLILKNVGDETWLLAEIQKIRMLDRVFGYQTVEKDFLAEIQRDMLIRIRAALAVTKYDLLRLASHCKNSYFSEEKEWRLALPHPKGTPFSKFEIKYRGVDHTVPYLEHDLFQNQKLPIIRVMTGARCADAASISKLLLEFGYEVPVVIADGPLRP